VANIWSNEVRFYAGGYDPGTSTTRASVTLEAAALDKTAFGDAAEAIQAGLRSDSIEWAGWFADGSKSYDSMLGTIVGTTGEVVSMFIGTTTGDRAYAAEVLSKSAKPVANIGELVRAEAEFIPDGTVSVCKHFGSALSLDGTPNDTLNSGSVDDSALSTGTGHFFSHILLFSAGGTGTLTTNLDHSANASTWANKVQDAFTATGSKKTEFTGTLNRYVRFKVGIGGTSTGTINAVTMYERP